MAEDPTPWLPQKFQAFSAIVAAEAQLFSKIMDLLGKWATKLRSAVFGSTWAAKAIVPGAVPTLIDPLGVRSTISWFDAQLSGDVLIEVREIFDWASGDIADPEPNGLYRAQQAVSAARNRLVGIPDSVFRDVQAQTFKATTEGWSIDELAARVDAILAESGAERWRNRARTIARTEAVAAYNGGTYSGFLSYAGQVAGDWEKVWLCLAGDTEVLAEGVTHAARRWHEGKAVTLRTASGRRVTMTPEHPVLTPGGWVQAQFLRPGDHVASIASGESVGAPDVEHAQPVLGQRIDALLNFANPASRLRGMLASVDLNGHGPAKDVDVVPVEGSLSTWGKFRSGEPLQRLFLEASDQALCDLARQSALSKGLGPAGCQDVDSGHSSHSVLVGLGDPASADNSSLAAGPERDLGLPQDSGGGGGAALGHASHGGEGLAGQIGFDQLVSVDVHAFSGHVYDLSTRQHWFAASGIIVHNCTHDNRVRPTHGPHAGADGQRVPLTSSFKVGKSFGMYPGDPELPPEECINCRCSLLLAREGEIIDFSNRHYKGGA